LEILVFYFIDMSEDHSIGLRVPAINSTIGFVFSLGFLGYKFSKEIDKNFIYFLYSVLLMIPSGIFITYKINIHPWFDKNDFGHLILVLTMILIEMMIFYKFNLFLDMRFIIKIVFVNLTINSPI
jgi:hypothetical protein